jgi:hypothetical protein
VSARRGTASTAVGLLTAGLLVVTACGANAEKPAPAATTSSTPASTSPATSEAPVSEQARPAATAATAAPGERFSSERAWDHLRRQVAFGPRPAGSPALTETRRYISQQLTSVGLAPREQGFTGATPSGPIPMVNLIATLPGQRPDRIVIATHYDTKRFREFPFVGASDGASSTAVVLELARVLASGPKPDYTIEFLFLDGEEAVVEWQGTDNTYGSRHYVEAARQGGTLAGLKALVLLDMVGDRDLRIRRDSNSTPWLVDLVWSSAEMLSHRSTFVNDLTTIEDDHLPFLRAGVPSVDIIDLDYPQWHTRQDDLDHVSAASLQTVGDVVLHALPRIQQRLAAGR